MVENFIHKCRTCGENFEIFNEKDYAYKSGNRRIDYFCSYKCYNTFLKEREKRWKDRHAEDFEDRIEHKTISLYTAYRYQQRAKADGLHLWFR